jgi:multiple sugar transport system ATP-binding protein
MARVRFAGVTKRYDDGQEAVADLTLDIADGELVVLVGPSGSGKSTALRMLAGLEDVTSGEILIGDEVVNDLPPRERDIAMVFQNYALYPHMTVRENMGFALRLEHVRKEQLDRRVREAAIALELDEFLDRKPAQLSGGQRQRVAMGRAIVREPQAFLMDEPLSNLDAKLRVQTREEIADLQRRLGVTTVYVTHDQTEALTLGDRIAVLRRGRLQQFGTPEELYLSPANVFVAGFIGSPAMNFIVGTVEDGTLRLPFGRVPLGDRLRAAVDRRGGAREVVLGLRPEDLDPVAPDAGADALRLPVVVDTVESTGADVYVHARVDGAPANDGALERILADDGDTARSRARDGTSRIVARLDPASGAAAGRHMTLGIDPESLYVFDAATGDALLGAKRDSAQAAGAVLGGAAQPAPA